MVCRGGRRSPAVSRLASEVLLFAQIGAGQWFRYLVGAVEMAGVLALLVPALATLAAAGLALDMAGASIVNIGVLQQPLRGADAAPLRSVGSARATTQPPA